MKRGRTAREVPPPLELECLCALWSLGEGNVQSVREILIAKKPLAYTTVMTMLERLTRKQVLVRRKVGRSFVYSPVVSRETVRQNAVRDLIESLFDGNKGALTAFLNGTSAHASSMGEHEPESLDAALL